MMIDGASKLIVLVILICIGIVVMEIVKEDNRRKRK